MSLPVSTSQGSSVSNFGTSSEKSYETPHVDSFGSRVTFAGRKVFNNIRFIVGVSHLSLCQPFGLVGAALGAGVVFVGGAVYKAGMHALGRAEQTRPLADYVVKAANKTRDTTCDLVGVVLTPVSGVFALSLSAAGVAGAALGATVTVAGTSVYNMVKLYKGEYAQTKNISDYVITGAEIGSYVAMFVAFSAASSAVMFFIPYGKLVMACATAIPTLSTHYVMSQPSWIEKKNKVD